MQCFHGMGCALCGAACNGSPESKGDEVLHNSVIVNARPQEREPPTLCFNAADLAAFGNEYVNQMEREKVAAMEEELKSLLTEERSARSEVALDEDTERGYLLFELEDQWEQAKLEDDLRHGVIPADRFVVPHVESHDDYVPPFVPPRTRTPLSVSTFALPSEQSQRGAALTGQSGRLRHALMMLDEFGDALEPLKERTDSLDSWHRPGVIADDDNLSDENTAVLTIFRSAMAPAADAPAPDGLPALWGDRRPLADSPPDGSPGASSNDRTSREQ